MPSPDFCLDIQNEEPASFGRAELVQARTIAGCSDQAPWLLGYFSVQRLDAGQDFPFWLSPHLCYHFPIHWRLGNFCRDVKVLLDGDISDAIFWKSFFKIYARDLLIKSNLMKIEEERRVVHGRILGPAKIHVDNK